MLGREVQVWLGLFDFLIVLAPFAARGSSAGPFGMDERAGQIGTHHRRTTVGGADDDARQRRGTASSHRLRLLLCGILCPCTRWLLLLLLL
jgi:hypothetical protein